MNGLGLARQRRGDEMKGDFVQAIIINGKGSEEKGNECDCGDRKPGRLSGYNRRKAGFQGAAVLRSLLGKGRMGPSPGYSVKGKRGAWNTPVFCGGDGKARADF